jgi:micrococcal nuclease
MQGLRPQARPLAAVLPLLLALWGASAGLAQEAEWASVLRVLDGQTIEVQWRGRREMVRYIGVAAPELRQPVEDPDEDHWARRAQYWNLRLVQGRRVRLEQDALPRDRQGRLLAYVFTQEGTFVNAWLIEFGFAEADARPPNLRYQAEFARLEREAREKARGLWMHR